MEIVAPCVILLVGVLGQCKAEPQPLFDNKGIPAGIAIGLAVAEVLGVLLIGCCCHKRAGRQGHYRGEGGGYAALGILAGVTVAAVVNAVIVALVCGLALGLTETEPANRTGTILAICLSVPLSLWAIMFCCVLCF